MQRISNRERLFLDMKNEENAIEVRDVTKTFKVYYDKRNGIKGKTVVLEAQPLRKPCGF